MPKQQHSNLMAVSSVACRRLVICVLCWHNYKPYKVEYTAEQRS